MKKIVLVLFLTLSANLLSSCTPTQASNTPAYPKDSVYSVGYYGFNPIWNANYSNGPDYSSGLGFSDTRVGWRDSYLYPRRHYRAY